MKKKFFMPLVLACALLFSACGGTNVDINPPEEDPELSVYLSENVLSLGINETATLTAYVTGDTSVKWYNSDASVVTLTANNLTATLMGKSAGTSTVTVVAGSKTAFCSVSVGDGGTPTVVVNSITLDETSKTLDLSETLTLTANVNATGGTPVLSWISSNEAVATVSKQSNNTALVTPKTVGSTNIIVSGGGKSATCVVAVEDYSSQTAFVKLDKSTLSVKVGATEKLNATTKPSDAVISWLSNDEAVATVNDGTVTGVAVGSAIISATITYENEKYTAECRVNVTPDSGDDYESQIAVWSKPGHLYFHYLRNTDNNYGNWALWMWPNYPNDGEGSLWGANAALRDTFVGVTPQTYGYMTNAECGGTGTDEYIDEYGKVIDVDLTIADLPGGKTGRVSPLVAEDLWNDEKLFPKAALGFLVVDETKMDGSDMWVSDGGAETYIKKLGKLMPEGKQSYLHVYAVEGNVSNYTTSSGQQVVNNPTLTDNTGAYRSVSDPNVLKQNTFASIPNSSSFMNDRPGTGYQIFVPSFCDSDGDGYGDIQGIISKLDYLEDLGIDVLWLTPIQESNSYHGYDVTDYYQIDQRFGTLQDYQELLYKAHARGMKVLMDMVINHTSKSNVLFQKSQSAVVEEVNGKTINYRDMYLWKFEDDPILEWDGIEGKTYTDKEGHTNQMYADFVTKKVQESDDWYRDGTSKYYYYGKFGSGMAELNYSCQATRDYMTDMCKYWLSFGLDGFRLDAIKHIYLISELDSNYNYANDNVTYDVSYRTYWNTETLKYTTVQNDYSYDRDLNVLFWKQFAGTLKSAYPNCFLVGENFDGWNERMAPFYQSMDSQFDFSLYYHLNEKPFEGMGFDIKNTLEIYKQASGRSTLINGAYTSNHDIARLLNHAAGHVEQYTASGVHHVEINNSNAQSAINNARVYAAFALLTPGVSWIYYGDELGMSGNEKDQIPDSEGVVVDDHGNNIDRWYRQPMRWGNEYGKDGVVNYGFGGLEVLWDAYNNNLATASQQQADQNSMFSLFKALCHAKQSDDYPTYGMVNNYWDEVAGSLTCLQISDGTRTVNVFINYSGSVQNISALNQGTLIGCSNGGSATTVGAYGFTVIKK